MDHNNHLLYKTCGDNGFLVDIIKLEQSEIRVSEDSENLSLDCATCDTVVITENFKVEKSGTEKLQVSLEQPPDDQPQNIELVTENNKLENHYTDEFEDQPLAVRMMSVGKEDYEPHDTDEFDEIEDQPLALRMMSVSKEDYIPHDTEFITENFKVKNFETGELQVSIEQPIHNQPQNIEFVTEKIKLENHDIEEFDEIEDLPLALRIKSRRSPMIKSSLSNSRSSRSRSSLNTSKLQQSDQPQKSSQNKQYKCKYCSEQCGTKNLLKFHIKSHFIDRPFKCADCGKCFTNSRNLETHINTICTGPGHDNKNGKFSPAAKPYVCGRCDRSFSSRLTIYSHSKSRCPFKTNHENKKIYKCAGCGNCYYFLSRLQNHLKTQCKEKAERINIKRLLSDNGQVEELDTFNEPENQTWSVDAGDTPYKCAKCEISYSKPLQLKKHVQSHRKKEVYLISQTKKVQKNEQICPGCSKKFKDTISLNNHITFNSSEEPFNCTVCEMQMELKCSLRKHKMTHPRPFCFHCDYCGKLFTEPIKLRIHIRVHTEEKPYKCEKCEKPFASPYVLKKHMKKYRHKVRPFRCDHCGSRFILLQNLKYHMKKFRHKSDISALKNIQQCNGNAQPLEVLVDDNSMDVNIKSEQQNYPEEFREQLTPKVDLEIEDIKLEQLDSEHHELNDQKQIHYSELIHNTIKQELDQEYLLGD